MQKQAKSVTVSLRALLGFLSTVDVFKGDDFQVLPLTGTQKKTFFTMPFFYCVGFVQRIYRECSHRGWSWTSTADWGTKHSPPYFFFACVGVVWVSSTHRGCFQRGWSRRSFSRYVRSGLSPLDKSTALSPEGSTLKNVLARIIACRERLKNIENQKIYNQKI